MTSTRHLATNRAEHIAEDEAKKEIEALWNNSNISRSQPTNTSTNTSGAPDTTTTTSPSDALSASTNWAKGMVDSAQQKVQGLQNLAS
ncbi:hypothetical protein OG21DRAFT_1607938 [Imleria badia]|nr:hypothetical protein OG21DRAFT_1518572 [Imleria badia]KAF8545771.1 hypothetical protein OG21DRAFT_1607938 [Imleria badia]